MGREGEEAVAQGWIGRDDGGEARLGIEPDLECGDVGIEDGEHLILELGLEGALDGAVAGPADGADEEGEGGHPPVPWSQGEGLHEEVTGARCLARPARRGKTDGRWNGCRRGGVGGIPGRKRG